jgi:hypothetical protein
VWKIILNAAAKRIRYLSTCIQMARDKFHLLCLRSQISNITGIISGLRWVWREM